MKTLLLPILLLLPNLAIADEYYDLGCYVGNMTREEFYAGQRHVEPVASPGNRFEVGAKVTLDIPAKDGFRVGDVFKITEDVFSYYRGMNLRTGQTWKLNPNEIMAVKADADKGQSAKKQRKKTKLRKLPPHPFFDAKHYLTKDEFNNEATSRHYDIAYGRYVKQLAKMGLSP